MTRHLKALAFVAALVIVACATRTVPYVATLPLDADEPIYVNGRTRCDLAGQPYVQVSMKLSGDARAYVLFHEAVHIHEIREVGDCHAFMARYTWDSLFRLKMEARAYCETAEVQRSVGVAPSPAIDTIALILKIRYGAQYTNGAIRQAMTCRDSAVNRIP